MFEAFRRLFAEHDLPSAIRSDNGLPFASGVDQTLSSGSRTIYAHGLTRSHGGQAASCWNDYRSVVRINIPMASCEQSKGA